MYAKSTRPSAKRKVQKDRSAKRDIHKFRNAKRAMKMCPRSGQIFCPCVLHVLTHAIFDTLFI